ncbi:VWA domain-containing protein [Aliamphritea hakodatensis]|uniref:VWA domain-containing protein n=1 Tax=Aliamphritea hakodatensis TaxID=2895352 RepID=UPI0022FD8F4C|nr:VWA domain-containing protein [Aliamphritea hakodatensis]
MITFIWPLAFLLLPLPLLARRYLKPVAAGTGGALRVPFYARFSVQQTSAAGAAGQSLWRLLMAWSIWGLLVTALARPALVGEEVPLPAQGRDLMMAIDLSGSMQEEDLTRGGQRATRLAVVKQAADDFLRRREGDRVGLVLFSDRAYLQAPLTFDREAVRELLGQAQVGLTGQKTAIGDAIAIAAKRLKDRAEDSRVLVLLTDGANNEGVMDPLQAAALAKKLGIRIYTIGVGADAVQVNTVFGRQVVNPSQGLDETSLRDIAAMTGGEYFRATDEQGLASIYRAIDRLEPVSGEPVYVRPEVALYFWPAGIALGLTALLAVLSLLVGGVLSVNRVNRAEVQ